jgi:hypothetical protein
VLKRFKHKPPTSPDKFTSLIESDWRRLIQIVWSVVEGGAKKEANKVTQALHYYQVQNDLLFFGKPRFEKIFSYKKEAQ